MIYRALKPIYTPWGDVFAVTWAVLPTPVRSMEEAKRIYGGSPVLEAIRK